MSETTYQSLLDQFAEFGIVEQIMHPVVMVTGLPNVKSYEIVLFENGVYGQVWYMYEHQAEVVILSSKVLQVGMRVVRTGKRAEVAVSEAWLGRLVDPLGKVLREGEGNRGEGIGERGKQTEEQEGTVISAPEVRSLESKPPSIMQRVSVTKPLWTGVTLVDLLLPLGRGQRQLIVGDRKTGKTGFLLNLIKTQVKSGTIVVVVLIGKQSSEVEQIRSWIAAQEIAGGVVMVVTTALDPQGLIYLAPYTGMTIAEYFRDVGKNTVVIFDDLSTHAKYYRELALLARRFPGRDAYPGDIFYTHARLLERGGNFSHSSGSEVAISCIPVAETTQNDLSDYIVSNLIGITDGHVLFDSVEFLKGRRPAINVALSVTRVGKQTQSRLSQDINQRLLAFLSHHAKTQNLAHLGAELSAKLKTSLQKGEAIYTIFNQSSEVVMPIQIQWLMLAMVWLEWLGDVKQILQAQQKLLKAYAADKQWQMLLEKHLQGDNLYDLLNNLKALKKEIYEVAGI